MAKVNNRKSDSWRPGMVANGTGMISKNQKRKEKRLSMNLNALKSNPGATPSKKQMLDQLNNSAQLNQNIRVPAFGKKNENKLLSTSLPIKMGKKFAPSSPQKNVKLTGILSNSNTPKSKGGKVTISKKVEERFIDSEAEEGEEPIIHKEVKPYEKGSLKRKLQKRKMSMQNEDESEDSELSDDDGSLRNGATKFFDVEASEGEETDDSEDSSDSLMGDSDGDDLDEEEDFDEEGSDLSVEDFSEGEAESGEEEEDFDEEEDENSAEDSDSEESESDSEVEEAIRQRIMATSKRRESVAAVPLKKEKAESTPLPKKIAVKPEPVTPQTKKAKVKAEPSSQPSQTIKKEPVEKPQQEPVDKKKQLKENVQKADDTKKAQKADGGAEKAQKADGETKKVQKADADAKKVQKKADHDDVKKSPYAGFIRGLPKNITADVVKATLAKTIDSQKIVGIREINNKNFIVYVEDENSLEDLLNKKFVIDEKCKFTVYKARESSSDKKNKFVAFLPRVSTSITHEILRAALMKELGADEVDKILDKRLYKPLQTRNVLVHLTNLEALQKMVRKEVFKVGSSSIVVRPAFETGVSIPTFRVVFNGVPEKTSEDALKSAIESKIGKNTVTSVRYSLTKPAYAFVSVVNAEAQQKALKLGNKVSVNGTKLEVTEFIAKNPLKKRAAPSEQAKERKKNKRSKKRKLNNGEAADTPKPDKENKGAAAVQQNGSAKNKKQNASTEAPDSGAKDAVAKKKKNKQKPGKGPNANQEPNSPIKVSVPVKGAGQKPEPQSPAKKTDDGSSPSPSKQKKKKNKQKNKQQNQNQQSPKAVDPKKQALTMKIESKKKNKKKGLKQQE